MLNRFAAAAALLVSPLAVGAPAPSTSISTRELANQEATAPATANKKTAQSASDAQISSGLLRLEDPGLNPATSPWTWQAGLRLQNLAPRGEAQMNNGQSLALDNMDSRLYPIIGLALRRALPENETAVLNAGLRLEAGYGSQDTVVRFPTGVRAENSRLNTGLAEAGLSLSARFHRLPSVELEAGWVEGLLSYSHTSNDSGANFTHQGRFRGPRVGAFYWPGQNWSVGVENETRSANDIEIQTNNLSLSTRMTW